MPAFEVFFNSSKKPLLSNCNWLVARACAPSCACLRACGFILSILIFIKEIENQNRCRDNYHTRVDVRDVIA